MTTRLAHLLHTKKNFLERKRRELSNVEDYAQRMEIEAEYTTTLRPIKREIEELLPVGKKEQA